MKGERRRPWSDNQIAELLLVVAIRPAALEPLEQTRHDDHRRHHTDPGQTETHGDGTQETCQQETDGQPDQRGHHHDDTQLRGRTALEDGRLRIEPVGQDVVTIWTWIR